MIPQEQNSNLNTHNNMTIYEKLAAIQQELNCPKKNENKFGGYMYRKAEDILEAVKPLLAKYGCILTCHDDLVNIGERYYIKATAILHDIKEGGCWQTTAYAREEETKKGMDGSQITGASSSYARKYALNGLFAIDDTADSDTTNVGDGNEQKTRQTARKAENTGNPAPAAGYKPIDKATYDKIIAAYATGRRTKTGGDYMHAWIETTNAGEAEIRQFQQDVADYLYKHQNG